MTPVAEILAIGTEILLGEIQDTNTRSIARALRSIGLTFTEQGPWAITQNASPRPCPNL